jgi:hypothetical protein
MKRWFAVVLSSGIAMFPAVAVHAQAGKLSGPQAALAADNASGGRAALPPLPPPDTSTIFGGAIRKVDPLLDQFTLDIYGQHPMKVLYDARTQVFRDGQRVPVQSLAPVDHASVQTALDGTHIFAMRIHILSQTPTGNYRGRVLRYDRATGVLELDAAPASRPIKVVVPGSATFSRSGQTAFTAQASGPSDLQPGALVSVTFAPGAGSRAVATKVVVLAVPGSAFIFSGNITALDTATGTLTLVDPRNDESYQLSFYPGEIPENQPLHIGERVRITASYNGGSYVASEIRPY